MGVLSRALAILLAVNMAVMLGLPIGIFADTVNVSGGYEVEYGQGGSEGTEVTPSQEESAQEPAASTEGGIFQIFGSGFQIFAPSGGGYSPMAIRTAGTWAELRSQITAAASGDTIEITADISHPGGAGNDLPAIAKNLIIDGKGHTLNFGTRDEVANSLTLGEPATATAFTLKNAKITKAGNNPLIRTTASEDNSANWTVNLENVSSNTGTTTGIINVPRGTVNFSGTDNTWTITANQALINARTVNFTAQSKASLSTGRRVIESTQPNCSVNATDGADIYLYSINDQTIWLQPSSAQQPPVSAGSATLNVSNGAKLSVEGDGYGTGDDGATVTLVANSGGYNVTGGGKLSIKSLCGIEQRPNTGTGLVTSNDRWRGQPAAIQQITNGTFTVAGAGSELYLESNGNSNTYGATIRFRYGGGQKFNISDNARVDIIKNERGNSDSSRDVAAVRFGRANGNEFHVTSGAVVHIENKGDAQIRDATTSDGDNAAIEYDDGFNNFVFEVSGYKSAIELIAHKGPAVDATGQDNGQIIVGEGAVFEATGTTASATSAIFAAGKNFTFNTNNPLFYDFANARTGGGRIFAVENGTFTSTDSDVALWGNGQSAAYPYNPIDGNPTVSRAKVTYSLSGANFGTRVACNDTTLSPYLDQGLVNFTRVNGNNAKAQVKTVLGPTNADKAYRATATVPEGLNDAGRGAFTNEVYATIRVVPYDNPSNPYTITGVSLESETVYGDDVDGLIRYVVPNDGFLRSGDTYQILEVWRANENDPDKNSPFSRLSDPSDFDGSVITVQDVTPPTPVEITSHSTEIWTDETTISGTYADMATVAYNSEPITRIYLTLNDKNAANKVAEATLDNATKTWSATIPAGKLVDGSKLYVVAVDSTGNENPLVNTDFHDATFLAAKSLDVKEYPIYLEAKNKTIYFDKANEIKNAGNEAAINDALEALIEAKAVIKDPNRPNPPSTEVSVIGNDGFPLETFNRSAWLAKYGDVPKTFTITYQLDADPSHTATATVTVEPLAGPGIHAEDFRISVNNALDLLAKSAAEQAADIIALAKATAYESLNADGSHNGTLSPDNVILVTPHNIVAVPGQYAVTFAMKNQPANTITITATVTQGNTPILNVTTPIIIWSGDPNDPNRIAGSILPAQAPRTDADFRVGVTALEKENGADITDRVTHTGTSTTVNTAVNGFYPVVYTVKNDDNNTTTATRVYRVTDSGTEHIDAHSFVVNKADANVNDIIDDADAQGWNYNAAAPGGKVAANVLVKDAGGYGAGASEGTYTITLVKEDTLGTPNEETYDIQAVITQKDHLNNTATNSQGTHYAIGANNVLLRPSEVSGYLGTSSAAQTNLKTAAAAQGWQLRSVAADAPVVVPANGNGIPTNYAVNIPYDVTFAIEGITTIFVTVQFTISNDPPVITFTEDPLVIPQTKTSHKLTPDELKAKMTVMDIPDGNLLAATKVFVSGREQVAPGTLDIDSQNIGVTLVQYRVTDSDGATTIRERYVVVDDGRFKIEDTNNDGAKDIIIGARDFLIQRAAITGGADQVRNSAFAEAFDNNTHTPLAVSIQGEPSNWAPAGWDNKPNPNDPTEYPFTLYAAGYPTVTKAIRGIASGADVVNPGTKNSQYGLVANHFTVNQQEAADILVGGDPAFVAAARAEAIPLVPGKPSVTPTVVNRGGFSTVEAVYPIKFGVEELTADINGKVSQGENPVITASTPLEVWIGTTAQPSGSILPTQYGDRYNVTATDAEDGSIASDTIVVSGTVNLTKVGLYRLDYDVVDSDGNHPDNPPSRIVVVNDGRYVVGKANILLANGFVIQKGEVETNKANNSAAIRTQILGKSDATLYDGKTGDNLGSIQVSVLNYGGYGNTPVAVGEHQITLQAPDGGSATISRNITAKIVEATDIDNGPKPHDPTVNTTYIYGNDIEATLAKAQDLITGGNSAILTALGAGADIAIADGTITPTSVKITKIEPALAAVPGIYKVTIADVDDVTSLVLNISVYQSPLPVINAPEPVVVAWTDSTANLTRAELMNGTYLPKSNTPWAVTASDDPDGDLTSKVEIIDPATGLFPVIPHNVVAVYPVIYRVVDSDGGVTEELRSVLIDDGNVVYDDKYILLAASFLIPNDEVDSSGANAQILDRSGAEAWRTKGVQVDPYVVENAGYTKQSAGFNGTIDYRPIIGINGYAPLTKQITARIYDDNHDGDNGALYSILAKNFRINLADAVALQAKSGTAAYETEFLTRADVKSYLRNTTDLVIGGTPKLSSASNFATATFAQPSDPNYPTVIPITFWVDEERTVTATINATVSNGSYPRITVPTKKVKLNSVFDEPKYMEDVVAQDDEDGNITSRVTHDTPVNTAIRGIYRVTYNVTDLEGNPGTVVGIVVVDLPDVGDYAVDAYSFIRLLDETQGTNGEILGSSHADAWRTETNDPAENHLLPINVKDRLFVADDGGYVKQLGDYDIELGVNPEPGYSATGTVPIKAKIIDRKIITEGAGAPTDRARYVVAADSPVSLYPNDVVNYIGETPAVKQRLIDAARAVSYELYPAITADPIKDHDVDVKAGSNSITAGAQPGDSFTVVFIPEGISGVELTVTFIVNGGNNPVITFTEDPLVITQSATSHTLTDAELKAKMTVTDVEDGNLLGATVVTTPSGPIDQHSIGVYKANYDVVDSHGNTAHASRLVVIDDGRYIIGDEDNDGTNDIVIGARDFVIKRAAITGGADQVRSAAFAEAYDNKTQTQLLVSIQGEPSNWAPAGWNSTPNPNDPTEYPFTLYAVGHDATTKAIKGIASGADVVNPGTKDSQYGLVANHFLVNTTEAAAILAIGDPAFIEEAKAEAIPLVPNTPAATPKVVSRGGFSVVEAIYPIQFGVADLNVTIDGEVNDLNKPVITAPTPLEVWTGSDPNDPNRASYSVLPSQYSDTLDVTAFDTEDGDITSAIVVSGDTVDVTKPGLYKLNYDVTDSDHNKTYQAQRIVVVNDGRYVVGQTNILLANGFVIQASEVATDKSNGSYAIRQQVLAKSDATLFSGTSGDSLGSIQISVVNYGGYGDTPVVERSHQITLNAPDGFSGTLSRTITAEIKDVTDIDDGPKPHDPTVNTTYVYGNDILATPSEAQDLIDGGDSAVLIALGAGASLAEANGTISSVGVKIIEIDPALAITPGLYTVTVADVNNVVSIDLTINVHIGDIPVITAPKPIVVAWTDSTANLTKAELLKGTYLPQTNTPWAVTADDTEDGNLTDEIVITDPATGLFPVIPHNVVGVYPIVYNVVDSDGNWADPQYRSVLIDDGNVPYDPEYILLASSFLIPNDEVDANKASAQILERSNAEAWTTDGKQASPYVVENAGYTKQPAGFNGTIDYRPIIGVNGYAPLTKQITARIYDDNHDGDNGDLYSLLAKNFRINLADAVALQAKSGTAAYETEFLSRANVKSYLRNTTDLSIGGTPKLSVPGGDGGFATATFAQPGDPNYPTTIPITFWVDEEQTVTVTINAIVSNGSYPTITVPAPKVIAVGDPFTDADYRQGVTAHDDEDGDLTSSITYTPTVDTSKRGVYQVPYEVVDSEGNRATAIGIVTTVPVYKDYIVDAYSFVKIVDEVTGTDREILDSSYAKAWRWKTDPPNGPLVDVTDRLFVEDRGGYIKQVGDYTIGLAVDAEQGYEFGDGPATLTAKVIDRDVIDDGTGVGNDPNRYVVAANNSVIRFAEIADFVGDSSTVQNNLLGRAEAVAYKLVSDEKGAHPPVAHDAVVVLPNPIVATAQLGDTFTVTFAAKDAPDVTVAVVFTIIRGNLPVLTIDGPLEVPATDNSQKLSRDNLIVGVKATDVEDGDLTSKVEVLAPGTTNLPDIDTSVPGVYQVEYKVVDADGNSATALRAVVVNDGRYVIVPDPVNGTLIIGAKNYVIKKSDVSVDPAAAITQAKLRSFAEAFDEQGQDISNRIELAGGSLPTGYLNKELGVYPLTWTLQGRPDVTKAITGEIIDDGFTIAPEYPAGKSLAYVVIAKDFSVNTTVAAGITLPEHFVSYASARVIKLIDAAPDRKVILESTGGFKAEQGVYPIVFRAEGIPLDKLSVTIEGTVTNRTPPILTSDVPIKIPIAAPGTADIDPAQIIAAGRVTAIDAEDGNLIGSVQVTDRVTGLAPSIPADQPGVYSVIISVTDSDNNTVAKTVAVVVDDGHFVYTAPKADESGFILRAHGFNIDLEDVDTDDAVEQIRKEGEVQAWRNDGVEIGASVISTGGYRDVVGDYRVVVGVYDSGATAPPTIVPPAALSKPITASVIDDRARYRVTFDANGGTLIGPRVITVIAPQTTLPYLPASPIRDGYTFRYWGTTPAGTTQFTADTPLTGDITVYAIWAAVPPPPPPPPPTVIVNNPPAGGVTYVTVQPATQTATPEPTETIEEPTTPETIGDNETAKAPPAPGWSLFDLLATILALLLLVVFFIKFFYDRPRDEDYEEEPLDAQIWDAMTPEQRAQYQARREADYQAWQADQQKRGSRHKALFVNAPVLLIVGAALVEAVVILALTQDFTKSWTIVDAWSVLFALIVFVQLLAPMVAAIIRNSRRENQETLASDQSLTGGGSATA